MQAKLVVLTILILVGSLPFEAISQTREAELEREISRLQHELHVYNIIKLLELKAEQSRQLLTLTRDMLQDSKAYFKEAGLHRISFEKALQLFRAEDAKNQGFSPEVEGKTATLSHQEKEMRKRFSAMVNRYEDRALQILSAQQRLMVQYYRPQLGSVPRKNSNALMEFFIRIRNMPEETFNNRGTSLVRQYLKTLQRETKGKGKRVVLLPTEEEILQNLQKIRGMSEVEFTRNAADLAEKFLPTGPVIAAQKQLQEIHEKDYGSIGNAGKFLLSPYAIPYYGKLLETESH